MNSSMGALVGAPKFWQDLSPLDELEVSDAGVGELNMLEDPDEGARQRGDVWARIDNAANELEFIPVVRVRREDESPNILGSEGISFAPFSNRAKKDDGVRLGVELDGVVNGRLDPIMHRIGYQGSIWP